MLLDDIVGMLTARAGSETRWRTGVTISAWELADVVRFVRIKSEFASHRRFDRNTQRFADWIIEMRSENVGLIVNQVGPHQGSAWRTGRWPARNRGTFHFENHII